ncbi:MAG: hypothetical protein IJU70_14325 [Lentisphaeria bacterium]|nr:hypothetical protein [Lentisphaeria bacterium]
MSTADYILQMQGQVFPALAVCVLFALAALGIGGALTRRCDVLAFSLGMVVIALLSLLLLPLPRGRTGLYAAYFVLVPPAVFGGCLLERDFRKAPAAVVCGSALFLLFLGAALLPPYGWDEQVYQIELLSRYLQNGSQAVLADDPYSAWPGLLQSFLLGGYTLGGLSFPRLFNALLGAVISGTLFSSLSVFGKKSAAVFTAAVVLSPLFLVVNRAVYAENAAALFVLAGVLALIRLHKAPAQACMLAGVFSGAAAAVKLTSGGAVLALFFLCACEKKNRKFLLLFVSGAAAAALPFFFRVWACTGNPVYPFAAAVFGTSRSVELHHLLLGSFRYGMGPLYGTAFGWIFTAFSGKLYDGVTTGFQQLVMLAAVCTVLRLRLPHLRARLAARFSAALLLMYLFWSLTSQQTRFLLPAFIGLAALAAFSATMLASKYRNALLLCVAAATLATPFYPHFKHFFLSWRIAGQARREPLRFLAFAQKDPDFPRILESVGRTPPESRILLLYEKRGLYVPRRHSIADPDFQEKYFVRPPRTPGEFVEALDDGDYLLIGSDERNVDLQEGDLEKKRRMLDLAAAALREGRLERVCSAGNCHLLLIRREGAAGR